MQASPALLEHLMMSLGPDKGPKIVRGDQISTETIRKMTEADVKYFYDQKLGASTGFKMNNLEESSQKVRR